MRGSFLTTRKVLAMSIGLIILYFVSDIYFLIHKGTPNPVHQLLIKNSVRSHLASIYPHEKFRVADIDYDFYMNRYHIDVVNISDPVYPINFNLTLDFGDIHGNFEFYQYAICKNVGVIIKEDIKKHIDSDIDLVEYNMIAYDVDECGINASNYKQFDIKKTRLPIGVSINLRGEEISKEEFADIVYSIKNDISSFDLRLANIGIAYENSTTNKYQYSIFLIDSFNCTKDQLIKMIE